jgi:hypothetical protein
MAADLPPRLVAYVDQLRTALAEQQGDDFERLQEALLGVQVCTSLSDEEATARMNLTPSGTSHGWQLTDLPDAQPVPCAEKPSTHRHLVFEC